jgi:hypothetical protein
MQDNRARIELVEHRLEVDHVVVHAMARGEPSLRQALSAAVVSDEPKSLRQANYPRSHRYVLEHGMHVMKARRHKDPGQTSADRTVRDVLSIAGLDVLNGRWVHRERKYRRLTKKREPDIRPALISL